MLQHRELPPPMTTIAALLTQKQHLLSRLEESPGPNEREEIERLLDKIDERGGQAGQTLRRASSQHVLAMASASYK